MFNVENLQQLIGINLPKSFFLLLVFLILTLPSTTLAAHPCERASQDLKGDMDVIAGKGGLWALMEQRGLKDKSVLGIQADGKIARAVIVFSDRCKGENKPGKDLYVNLQNLLGEARTFFNPRSSNQDMTSLIEKLNKKLDVFLKKMD